MPLHPVQISDDTGIGYLIIVIITLLGAVARVFYNWMTGSPVSALFAVGQIFISIFASSIMFLIAIRLEWRVPGIAASCGLAAWMGNRILMYFEKRLLDRLGEKK